MKYKTIKLWTHPNHYFGDTFYDYYVGIGRSRDSNVLENSNFEATLDQLGGESETVIVCRSSHWAVGWVEQILVHRRNKRACKTLDDIMTAYENYPVVDDSHYIESVREELNRQFKYYETDFINSVCKYIGIDAPKTKRSKAYRQLSDVAYELFNEAEAYYGIDDAFVSLDNIAKLVPGAKSSGTDIAKINPYFQACMSKAGVK